MRGKHAHTHTHIIININLFNKTLAYLINLLTDVGLQNCTHQLHAKDHTGPLCQMSLHDSVLRLLISKFCHILFHNIGNVTSQ